MSVVPSIALPCGLTKTQVKNIVSKGLLLEWQEGQLTVGLSEGKPTGSSWQEALCLYSGRPVQNPFSLYDLAIWQQLPKHSVLFHFMENKVDAYNLAETIQMKWNETSYKELRAWHSRIPQIWFMMWWLLAPCSSCLGNTVGKPI